MVNPLCIIILEFDDFSPSSITKTMFSSLPTFVHMTLRSYNCFTIIEVLDAFSKGGAAKVSKVMGSEKLNTDELLSLLITVRLRL